MSRFRPSTVRAIAWASGLASIALMLAGLGLMFADRNALLPADLQSWAASGVLDAVNNLWVPLIGMILAARRPENLMGWLFLVAGAALAVGTS